MSLRTIILLTAAIFIGIAGVLVVSTETFARTPTGTTRLDPKHHHHHKPRVHHSGQVRH